MKYTKQIPLIAAYRARSQIRQDSNALSKLAAAIQKFTSSFNFISYFRTEESSE